MKYRCENGHTIKRTAGQTTTKCGLCQDTVKITPLPQEDQHNLQERDRGRCYGRWMNKQELQRAKIFKKTATSRGR